MGHSLPDETISTTCDVSDLRNDSQCKYKLLFPEMNSTGLELIYTTPPDIVAGGVVRIALSHSPSSSSVPWEPSHQSLMSSQFKSRKYQCCSCVINNDSMRPHFCTCHDSRAVVTCTNMRPDYTNIGKRRT